MDRNQGTLIRQEQQNVRSRSIVFAVFVVLVLVLAGAMSFGVLRLLANTEAQHAQQAVTEVERAWETVRQNVVGRLWGFTKLAVANEPAISLISSGRRDRLAPLLTPWFQAVQAGWRLSRFLVIGADRRIMLKVAGPGASGDLVESPLLSEAEQSHHAASGLVVGVAGYDYSSVVPLIQGGRTVGYVDLGVDGEGVVKELADMVRAEAVLLVRKDAPELQQWRPASWDRLPEVAVVAESRAGLADNLVAVPGGEAVKGNPRMRLAPVAVAGTADQPTARIEVLFDDSERRHGVDLTRMVFLGGILAVCGLAVGLAYLLLYRLLPKVEMSGKDRQSIELVSMRDGLTGLYNLGAFDGLLHKELIAAHQGDLPLAVMFIAIDEYRNYNEIAEKGVEERVVVAVAETLQRQLRPGDLAIRTGGDGFAVILVRVGGGIARDVGERVRRAIVATRVEAQGRLLTLGACIGVSCYPDHGRTPTDLIREAEQALSQARAHGRNTVRLVGSDFRGGAG